MNLPTLSVDDRQWMTRRLARTGWLAVALLALNFVTTFAFKPNGYSPTSRSTAIAQTPDIGAGSTDASMTSLGSGRKLNAVPPVGWRKSNRGWEHVSTWKLPSESINTLIETQAAREPALARGLLAKVSKFSPVKFAICQIAAILAIIGLVKLVTHRQIVDTNRTAVKLDSPAVTIDG